MATTYPLSLGLLIMFLFVAHAAVMRGRNWGAWWVAVICIGSMLVALSTYGRRPHLFILTTTLLAGLLGLLVLNSRRYREMRLRLAEHRELRRLGRTRQTLIKDSLGASIGFVGSGTVQDKTKSIALGLYEELE